MHTHYGLKYTESLVSNLVESLKKAKLSLSTSEGNNAEQMYGYNHSQPPCKMGVVDITPRPLNPPRKNSGTD
jgi:hypothetical protein